MNSNEWMSIIPVLKINNRSLNQRFYEETLGMKSLLEEGSLLSLGDQSGSERLQLDESPSMRSRRVVGPMKLSRLVFRAAKPAEIEALLAKKPAVSRIYRGEKGYAFEALSPEGHRFLLHAEEDRDSLAELGTAPVFAEQADFKGLSSFELDTVEINVPDLQQAETFYSGLTGFVGKLRFREAEGPDLQVENGLTWDLSMLRCQLKQLDTAALSAALSGQEVFIPKSGSFLLSQDKSRIELWFEEA